MSANPLVVTAGERTSASLAGAGLLDSGQALADAIKDGSWVEGGLAGFSTAMDVVSTVMDPLGSLFSAGIGWVIEHFDPIKGWFDDLAGNSAEVAAFGGTWSNVAGQLRESGDLLDARVAGDLADMEGQAVTAYCSYAKDVANHIRGAGDWAEGIASGLTICSTLVQMVHDLARDCLAQVVGTALSMATELLCTLGAAAPHALSVIATKVSNLATKLGKAITRLLNSLKSLKGLLKQLDDLFARAKGALDGLLGAGGRSAGRGLPGEGTTPISDLPQLPETRTVRFDLKSNNPKEFGRQLSHQEDGLNSLTVDEFLRNRDEFLARGGRDKTGDAYQRAARNEAELERFNDLLRRGVPPGLAKQRASAWIKTQAALHNPDQVAGGYAHLVSGVGDASVNHSIGSQWRTRIKDLDTHIRDIAKDMTPEQRQTTRLNVRLTF